MDKKTMRAAVFKGNGVLALEQVPVPAITRPTDVLLRPEAASICGSDMHILSVPPGQRGDPGTIMGHEFAATVVDAGAEVFHVAAGDRVVVEPNIHCGVCTECRGGFEELCRNAQNIGQWRNGGFADYCVAPAGQLHPIPAEMPARLAALAEPLACVMHGMMRLNPMPQERVVIFGAGAIGMIFLRVLKIFGVREVAVCETMEKRRRDAERGGADCILDPAKDDIAAVLDARWGGLADAVVDAVGAGAVFEQAVDLARPGGRVLVFGQNINQKATIRPAVINIKELTIFATLSTRNSFPPAIELLKNPALNLETVISHEIPLSGIHRGLELMRSHEAVKVIVYPD